VSGTQKLTVDLGVVYLLVGVLGFAPGITMASAQPGQGLLLGIFAVNALHNVAHLVVGAVLVWAGLSALQVTLLANKALALVFALLVVASFVAPLVEGVALNPPDTALHLLSLLATGYLGFAGGRRAVSVAA